MKQVAAYHLDDVFQGVAIYVRRSLRRFSMLAAYFYHMSGRICQMATPEQCLLLGLVV